MAWPPALPSTGFVIEGVPALTTIVWGTDWAKYGALGGYIVKSVRPSERVEEMRIENGTGLTAVEILLIDGQDYEVTVVDETTVLPPVASSVILLQSPFVGPHASGDGTAYFLVVNNSYNSARKQEGERVILARSFTAFSLGTPA